MFCFLLFIWWRIKFRYTKPILSRGNHVDIHGIMCGQADERYNFRFDWLILTHWGRVTHICVSKLTIIGSDNGLSPDRRQAIIWTNAGLLLIWPLGTNFNEILIEILTFSCKKMRLKVSSAKRRTFCLGLNVLTPAMIRRRYSIVAQSVDAPTVTSNEHHGVSSHRKQIFQQLVQTNNKENTKVPHC